MTIEGTAHDDPVPDIHAAIADLVAAEPGIDAQVRRHVVSPMRFINRRYRDDHVRKHVLATREERWHQILDPELVAAVRNDPDDGVVFDRLAVAYESELASAFEEAIGDPRRAVGLVRFEVVPPRHGAGPIGGFRVLSRSIIAWCPVRRLRIIAGFPVSRAGVTSYRLLSGYRHDLRGSAGRFVRAVRERILDRVDRSQERLVDPFPDERAIADPRSLEHG